MSDPAAATSGSARELLRHTVATLAYRGRKAVEEAPPGFADFRVGPSSRTPGQILSHICDLLDWAGHLARGSTGGANSEPLPWADQVARFYRELAALDAVLSSGAPLGHPPEQLFQGPIADALQHVGQITMLRRLASAPVRGENYFVADIAAGRVGSEQSAPRREFD
jgi:hypothetical protein